MGTDKRARQKELSRTRAEEARREAEAQAKRRRNLNLIGLAAIFIAILAIVAVVVSGGDEDTNVAADSSTTAPATETTEAPGTASTIPANIAPADVACPPADGSGEHYTGFSGPLPDCIDPAKTYQAEVQTNLGTFTIEFDAERAPKTVNNFVTLARYGYYDGLIFHRIIDGFMFQGGDPTGTGSGGPGYKFDDELPQAGEYEMYSVAMANSGPNTNGSQFFVITGPSGVSLPPNYSLFGKVIDGTDVADAIGKVETAAGDRPIEDVVMEKVTITEV